MLLLWISTVYAANWAVLVSTSNAWNDYRHTSNVMAIYQELRALQVPPGQIVLMTAGSFRCDSRNLNIGKQQVGSRDIGHNVFPDYKGREVTVDTLYRVLANRGARKPLKSTANDNVLVYLTGHGGDGILGFQDSSLHGLSAAGLNAMLHEMWVGGRYKNAMVMVDSCQSETMIQDIDAPNIIAVASAKVGHDSFSIAREHQMGISEIDQFSLHTAELLRSTAESRPKLALNSTGRAKPAVSLAEWYQQRAVGAVIKGRGGALWEFFHGLNTIIT